MMKFKRIAIAAALNMMLIASSSHANIVVFAPAASTQNLCDTIAGEWKGAGVVKTSMISCTYNGHAKVTHGASTNSYIFDVDLKLASGGFACPGSEKELLDGTCDPNSGAIILKSSDADLSGQLSPDGKTANLKGYVNVSVKGKKVKGTVEKMELHKQA